METIEREVAAGRRASSRSVAVAAARWRLRLGIRWVALVSGVFALMLLASIVTLHPPAAHARLLAMYWVGSGAVSLLLGGAALWGAERGRLAGIRVKLAIPPLLTALVIALNVVYLASQMFISVADGQLLLVFLAFGILVALTLSMTLAAEMADGIARIETGARRIAGGDYGFRVAEQTRGSADELARLARWFDSMAASVQSAFARQQAAETERRQVTAALSHDLRTPLTSVRAMIEAIDDGVVTDPETVRRYQHAIHNEVRRLCTLMDELFELSRLEAHAVTLERVLLSLEDVISDAVEATRKLAEQAGLHLYGQVESEVPLVEMDAGRIHRVLTNLLQNAIRHTTAGGAIVIRACAEEGEQRGNVQVQMIDTGSGIAAADLSRVFERTYRGEPSRVRHSDATGMASAGLGLAIAREIIELHGGRMWAVSPLAPELRYAVAEISGEPVSDTQPGTALCFTLPVR